MPPRPTQRRSSAKPSQAPEDLRGKVSVARAMSKMGICSRSEAEHAVRDGRVRVNGRVVTDLRRRVVPETDKITLDDAVANAEPKRYIMLNKPRGQVTTRRDPRGRATVYDSLTDPSLPFLGAVGRLDQASEGMLLFTNDTQWANAVSAPESHVRKTYHVQIDAVPDHALVAALRSGVYTEEGEPLEAAEVSILRAGERHGWLVIALDEGKNRQIRRMLEACGVAVLRLVRVAIGDLPLGDLAKGSWRVLTDAEVGALGVLAGRSSSVRRRQ